ncbi:MAG: hypothetical protein ACLSB9_31780 [Hydrogeniiclostridium mannosilyticum]
MSNGFTNQTPITAMKLLCETTTDSKELAELEKTNRFTEKLFITPAVSIQRKIILSGKWHCPKWVSGDCR